MKRIIAWLLLAAMLLAVLPAAAAEKNVQVDSFTVETTDTGFTVILPEAYAAKGYFKLFWKNEQTGDIQSAVFEVDTPTCAIEADTGAKYSFQLFYAKKRGLLPASWKEDKPEEPQGPVVWKVLWMDARTIEYPDAGIVNRMTEEDYRISEDASKDFEALIEEYTGGLVDIEITRMTLEEPVTTMTYYPDTGFCVEQSDVNMKHYAMRKYDSVFVFGRMDHILSKYNGFACRPENSREEPGYSFIRLAGEDCLPTDAAAIKYICVHEFLHQLNFFYETYQLEIPDPDKPENYGYGPVPGGILEPQFFREALTMTAVNEDGKYVGVPAEAWAYRPTKATAKRDLRSLQDQEAPADRRWQKAEAEPAETAAPAEIRHDPEALGTMDEDRAVYENTVMGLRCKLDNWLWMTGEEYYTRYNVQWIIDPEEQDMDFEDGLAPLYAESYDLPQNILFQILYPTETFIAQYDEAAFMEKMKTLLDKGSLKADFIGDFRCEIVQSRIGNRTLPAVKCSYLVSGIKIYQLNVQWLDGDHMNSIQLTSYMTDDFDSILERFRLLDS